MILSGLPLICFLDYLHFARWTSLCLPTVVFCRKLQFTLSAYVQTLSSLASVYFTETIWSSWVTGPLLSKCCGLNREDGVRGTMSQAWSVHTTHASRGIKRFFYQNKGMRVRADKTKKHLACILCILFSLINFARWLPTLLAVSFCFFGFICSFLPYWAACFISVLFFNIFMATNFPLGTPLTYPCGHVDLCHFFWHCICEPGLSFSPALSDCMIYLIAPISPLKAFHLHFSISYQPFSSCGL